MPDESKKVAAGVREPDLGALADRAGLQVCRDSGVWLIRVPIRRYPQEEFNLTDMPPPALGWVRETFPSAQEAVVFLRGFIRAKQAVPRDKPGGSNV